MVWRGKWWLSIMIKQWWRIMVHEGSVAVGILVNGGSRNRGPPKWWWSKTVNHGWLLMVHYDASFMAVHGDRQATAFNNGVEDGQLQGWRWILCMNHQPLSISMIISDEPSTPTNSKIHQSSIVGHQAASTNTSLAPTIPGIPQWFPVDHRSNGPAAQVATALGPCTSQAEAEEVIQRPLSEVNVTGWVKGGPQGGWT